MVKLYNKLILSILLLISILINISCSKEKKLYKDYKILSIQSEKDSSQSNINSPNITSYNIIFDNKNYKLPEVNYGFNKNNYYISNLSYDFNYNLNSRNILKELKDNKDIFYKNINNIIYNKDFTYYIKNHSLIKKEKGKLKNNKVIKKTNLKDIFNIKSKKYNLSYYNDYLYISLYNQVNIFDKDLNIKCSKNFESDINSNIIVKDNNDFIIFDNNGNIYLFDKLCNLKKISYYPNNQLYYINNNNPLIYNNKYIIYLSSNGYLNIFDYNDLSLISSYEIIKSNKNKYHLIINMTIIEDIIYINNNGYLTKVKLDFTDNKKIDSNILKQRKFNNINDIQINGNVIYSINDKNELLLINKDNFKLFNKFNLKDIINDNSKLQIDKKITFNNIYLISSKLFILFNYKKKDYLLILDREDANYINLLSYQI